MTPHKPVETGKRGTLTTHPRMLAAMKRDYEQKGLGWRLLSANYGFPRDEIRKYAKRHGWVKLANPAVAILVDGLDRPTRLGQTIDEMPPNPALRPAPDKDQPALGALEAGVEGGLPDASPATTPAAVDSPPPSKPKVIKDQPSPPLPEAPEWVKGARPPPPKTADIINFPGSGPPPQRGGTAIQLLPEAKPEERAQLRIALSTIKAMMTVEQVEQLEHHEGLLRRYSHLIEVYLEPQRFVDLAGMNDDDKAEKITATQSLALRMLLPTERDTLAGAIKVLTSSIQATIVLKRAVAGLHAVKGGAFQPSADPLIDSIPEPGAKTVDFSQLPLPQKRVLMEAMEIMQRHQHAQREAPRPPLPESIEDLRNPDFPLPEISPEPEAPR